MTSLSLSFSSSLFFQLKTLTTPALYRWCDESLWSEEGRVNAFDSLSLLAPPPPTGPSAPPASASPSETSAGKSPVEPAPVAAANPAMAAAAAVAAAASTSTTNATALRPPSPLGSAITTTKPGRLKAAASRMAARFRSNAGASNNADDGNGNGNSNDNDEDLVLEESEDNTSVKSMDSTQKEPPKPAISISGPLPARVPAMPAGPEIVQPVSRGAMLPPFTKMTKPPPAGLSSVMASVAAKQAGNKDSDTAESNDPTPVPEPVDSDAPSLQDSAADAASVSSGTSSGLMSRMRGMLSRTSTSNNSGQPNSSNEGVAGDITTAPPPRKAKPSKRGFFGRRSASVDKGNSETADPFDDSAEAGSSSRIQEEGEDDDDEWADDYDSEAQQQQESFAAEGEQTTEYSVDEEDQWTGEMQGDNGDNYFGYDDNGDFDDDEFADDYDDDWSDNDDDADDDEDGADSLLKQIEAEPIYGSIGGELEIGGGGGKGSREGAD